MKRMLILGFALAWLGNANASTAMSVAQISENARFLSDKMAYELSLSNRQYNDVYEINYNFIYSIQGYMDDVVLGYSWATEYYYDALDIRNDDLSWVLTNAQFSRFLQTDYFYRPVYVSGGVWSLGVYVNYPNRSHFYLSVPTLYYSYRGAHIRHSFSSSSYYSNRYNSHNRYQGSYLLRPNRPTTLPNRPNATRPNRPMTPSRPNVTRPSRPNGTPSTNRPSTTAPSRPSGTPSTNRPSTTAPSCPSGTPSTNRPSGTVNRPSTTTPSRPSGTPSTNRPSTTTPSRPSGTPTTRPSGTVNRPSTSTRPSSSSSSSQRQQVARPSGGTSNGTGSNTNRGTGTTQPRPNR